LNRKGRIAILLVSLMVVVSCGSPSQQEAVPEIEFLNTPEMEALQLPFSQAVRVGNLLFLSGQLGNEPGSTTLVPGGITEETKQTLENMKAILERNGSSMDRVVKCTVFMTDIREWPKMNEVYRTYFPKNPPARSALSSSGLALGARVEIECIAVIGDGQSQ